jgi:hypothetical protein
MADEDFDRKMEFIIEQQAQSVTRIGQLEDIVSRLANATLQRVETTEERVTKRFEDVEEQLAALIDSQIRLVESQSRTDENLREQIAALVDSQIRSAEAQSRTDENLREKISKLVEAQSRTDENLREKFGKLTEAQSITEENLRSLIAVVDRYFSEGRNGKAEK